MQTGKIFKESRKNVWLQYYLNEDGVGCSSPRPAMLVLPGGAFRMCSEDEGEPIALAYLSEGYQTFVLNYTVGDDCSLETVLGEADWAMEQITANAEKWKLDSERIGVIGFSAGGYLAALLGTQGKIRPRAMVLGYPCTREPKAAGLIPFFLPELDKKVDALTPPAFMFAASDDPIVPVDTLPFANALHENGKLFELHIFYQGGHGFSLGRNHMAHGNQNAVQYGLKTWFPLSVEWLNREMDNFPVGIENDKFEVPTDFENYSTDVAIKDLWKNQNCRVLLLEAMPDLEEAANGPMAETTMSISLRHMQMFMPEVLTDEVLINLDEKLKEIPVIKNV